ncbi:CPBP family intramembrane metalloprotease [Erythrobacter sp. LQ02-29]|uniref:CPBP family intramembrane glutamic endopeptidase n=1 Tax=Erythrobacter sp. LQ02-29 TaxID=2920384 RepID=UPI001F4DCD8F|nr:CPBP family intramembrane glutamic endopeptidase [Erythrobacter sp. LQ02-29]MCP9222717.1 CPBP family intramembrane metalloprotease [Erythrobacter sp. LQ02-29]
MTDRIEQDWGPAASVEPRKSLGVRIFEFPLMAMLVAIVVVVIVTGIAAAAMLQFGEVDSELVANAVPVVIETILLFAAYKLIVARLGERPRDDLPLDRRANDLWRGALWAGALMSAIVGVAALLGGYRLLGWGTGDSWEMIFFFAGVHAAFFEEILFRGIIFRFLEEFGGSWFALAISAALFGLVHLANDNASMLAAIAIAVEAGVLLGGAYMLTRNLWLAMGIHFGWNVVQGYVWDVPVSGKAVEGLIEAQPVGSPLISGGMFGLEASVVALVLATAAGVWLVALAVRRGHVVRPWWTRRRERAVAG